MVLRGVMRVSAIVLSAVMPMVATTACHDPTDVAQLVYVQVNGTQFGLGSAHFAAVPFSVLNPGRDTIYLARCGGEVIPAADRWEDDRWKQFSGGACPQDFSSAPLPLAPGGRYDGERPVSATGRFRLRVGAAASASATPLWRTASNAFDVQ